MRVRDALSMATRGGAQCLGRDDIGSLEPGKRCDAVFFDLNALGFSGAGDPLSALLLCAPATVDLSIIEGRIVIEDGHLLTLPLEQTLRKHRKIAARLVAS